MALKNFHSPRNQSLENNLSCNEYLNLAKTPMTYDPNNIFAKIIRGEIQAKKIYEDENILAFHDISKAAPTHALVIPKGAFKNFPDFVANETPEKISNFFKKVSEIATLLAADKSGFRLISNIGSDAHQTVPHFHVHILAGKKMGPLISSDNQLR
jgi:diadenosine tetraphosphate (Ap4A) HIT family hydrolase